MELLLPYLMKYPEVSLAMLCLLPLAEYYLGKTDKVKSGSILELALSGFVKLASFFKKK